MRPAWKRFSERTRAFSDYVQGVPNKIWVITATGKRRSDITFEKFVVADETLRPRFVIVVPDLDFLRAQELAKKLFAARAGLNRLEVYSCSAAATREFASRFQSSQPLADGFVVGILYCLLDCTDTFVPVTSYEAEYTKEMAEEMLYVLRGGGAKAIIIDENLYKEVAAGQMHELQLTLPEGTPVPAEVVSAAQARMRQESHRVGTMVEAEYPNPPEYRPYYNDAAEKRWFYKNKKLPSAVQVYIGALENGNVERLDMTVHLVDARVVENVDALQGTVLQVIGVGFEHDMRTRAEFDKTLTIKFFLEDDFEDAKQWGDERSRIHSTARRSLARLATQRAEHYKLRSMFREDILFFRNNGLAVTEAQMADMVENDLQDDRSKPGGVQDAVPPGVWARANEWFFGAQMEAPGKTLTVPFYVYGPAGAGKTSVLFTWMQALGQVKDYFNDGKEAWRGLSRGSASGAFETFKAVRFDPTPDTGRNRDRKADLSDEQMAKFSPKNMARVIVDDTNAATGFAGTADGRKFPFGTAILVLDYAVVAKAKVDQRGDAKEHLRRKAARDKKKKDKTGGVPEPVDPLDPFEPFLGDEPIRDVSGGADSRGGRLLRYPPMVAILAKCPEDVPAEARGAVEKWFADKYGVTWVHAMTTLRAPTDEQRRAFINKSTSAGEISRWTKIASGALELFDNVLEHTLDHEQDMVMHYLDKLAVEAKKAAEAKP